MSKIRIALSIILILLGITIIRNGMISGPRAFSFKWIAVVAMIIVGVALAGAGAYELFRAKPHISKEAKKIEQ